MVCRCSLSSEEIRGRYNEGTQAEADETTRIMFIPTSQVTDLQQEQRAMWNKLAPSAKGCFTLYVNHGTPDPPYDPAIIVK